VDAAKQQLQDNEAELKHLKKEGIPLKYAEHLGKDLSDNIQYKFAEGDPWKRTMSSMHGEKQWRKYSIGRIASRGKKRQKPKDNVIMTWVSGIEKAVENINLLLSHVRVASALITTPFPATLPGLARRCGRPCIQEVIRTRRSIHSSSIASLAVRCHRCERPSSSACPSRLTSRACSSSSSIICSTL
jgi:hypothetical protein